MLSRRRGIYRRRSHHFCNISARDIIRILASLIVPLTLGIVTISVTIYQLKLAQEDRHEDLNRFKDDRHEDLNRFKNERREARHESRIHREQQLNISKMNQENQNKIAANRYQDGTFKDYIKEIGDLMKENNGSLTSNRLTATLARVKTLNVLRQLDKPRQIHVIHFLFEARQFSNADGLIPLDLSTVELANIDFRKLARSPVIDKISLAGISLRNSTFAERTRLEHVNFTSTDFDHVNFSFNWLNKIDFSFADLLHLKFLHTKFQTVNFSSTRLQEVEFLHSNFHNASLSFANIMNVDFSYATISATNFSSTVFGNSIFQSARLSNADFSYARFGTTTFSFARLYKVNFSNAKLMVVNFSNTQLIDVNFSSSRFVIYSVSNFRHARMAHTLFKKCDCRKIDFGHANLSGSVFSNANLKNALFQNADLTNVNFSNANLWNSDFTNTTITNTQLQSALSIRNAKLPNGTLARGRNLIANGDAHCNITSLHPWHVQNGTITVIASKGNPDDCQFVLKSNVVEATMSQQINLMNIWNFTVWTYSEVELHLNRSSEVSVELNGLNDGGSVLPRKITKSTENMIIMKLFEGTERLEVVVKFNASRSNKSTWCDNIELFINYDM